MNNVACTIVSKNYIAYAKTWAKSMRDSNPGIKLYVLIVDRVSDTDTFLHDPNYETIAVEDLGIERFESISFKYSILELNTNVKPAFLIHLIKNKGADNVLYFDPDIYVFENLDFIYAELKDAAYALTPHILFPIEDTMRPSEQDHLRTGIFNLGFIAVSSAPDALELLAWWSRKCLHLAYNDNRDGLFVDQKWLDLAPALFPRLKIIRDEGCNVAYWNLQERRIEPSSTAGRYRVNKKAALTFFHFSGLVLEDLNCISKHQDRLTLHERPELTSLFRQYADRLIQNGHPQHAGLEYTFGRFSNGNLISDLARRIYSTSEHLEDRKCDPFNEDSAFYQSQVENKTLFSQSLPLGQNTRTYNRRSLSVQVINFAFKIARKLLGPDRYWQLCKYLAFYSVLRNQKG